MYFLYLDLDNFVSVYASHFLKLLLLLEIRKTHKEKTTALYYIFSIKTS